MKSLLYPRSEVLRLQVAVWPIILPRRTTLLERPPCCSGHIRNSVAVSSHRASRTIYCCATRDGSLNYIGTMKGNENVERTKRENKAKGGGSLGRDQAFIARLR